MDRAVSEMSSTLALVGIAVVIVLAVGANVLFVDSSDEVGPDAQFSFDYIDAQQALVITHEGVETVPARDLLIRGPQREVLWSQVNSRVDNQTVVGPETLIQIGRRNGYGERVRPSDRISILYANTTAEGIDEPVRLSSWNGTDDF